MSKKVFKDAELLTYEITFDENDKTGVRLISLVKDPAILEKGMYFSQDEIRDYSFKIVKEKQQIIGPALIPNIKIKRIDDDGDPYFVFFSEQTIRGLMEKFNANNTGKSVNINHTSEMAPATITENWIVEDPYYDKSRLYGFNLPEGSWVIMTKISDENFWNDKVKGEELFSFSVEGLLGMSISDKFKALDENISLNKDRKSVV